MSLIGAEIIWVPKIHKVGNPLRIIISCINSPMYPLASFLKDIIDKSLEKVSATLKTAGN